MENIIQPENDKTDFESDIDTWVIDKEDSNGSVISIGNTVQDFHLKTMNKENIKQFSDSSEYKSLRLFRIRKHLSYQEFSSESDSDSKRKNSSDSSLWNKKIRLESSYSLNGKVIPKIKTHLDSSSSLSSSNSSKKEKTSLNTEEISVILSEIESDEKSESSQEKREKLLSIENVSNTSDSKEKNNDNSLPSVNFTCSVCKMDCHSLDELQSHENVHRTSVSAASHQTLVSALIQENQDKLKQKYINRFDSSKQRADFLGTFKKHLIRKGLLPQNKNDIYKQNGEMNGGVTSKKVFRCVICNYHSSKVLSYKTHLILFHSDKTNLNCDYCNYTTTICVNLATHMKDHLMVCSQCNYQCLGTFDLNKHLQKCHSLFKCSKCDFTCDSQRKVNFHLKSHLMIEKFKCEHCKSAFSLKGQLKNHIEKHCVQSKPFKCNECEMSFSQKSDLKYHIKSHREVYICDVCKREFLCKNFLRLHLRLHDKESFKCNTCNSTFLRECHLKLHMRTHKSKDFKCEHCSFDGTSSDDISKHICIDKLYNVQKRSLNFTRESSEIDQEDKSADTTTESVKDVDLNQKYPEELLQTENVKLKKPVKKKDKKECQSQIEKRRNNKVSDHQKSNVNTVDNTNLKLRSLRQNLPSRINHKNIYNTEKIDGDLQCLSKKNNKVTTVVRKKIRNKGTLAHSSKPNHFLKTSQFMKIQKREYKERANELKEFSILKDLDCMKVIFSRSASITNLLVDPVNIAAGRYVECYYQNQSTATPPTEHLERHLSQRSLLSCRLCHYKTNSQYLLERHTNENHTWPDKVINILFS